MGIYNYWIDKLPAPLNVGQCCFCNNKIIIKNKYPEQDAFQYICKNCNENTVIAISGSLLADELFEDLGRNAELKRKIHEFVKNVKEADCNITTSIIRKNLENGVS